MTKLYNIDIQYIPLKKTSEFLSKVRKSFDKFAAIKSR